MKPSEESLSVAVASRPLHCSRRGIRNPSESPRVAQTWNPNRSVVDLALVGWWDVSEIIWGSSTSGFQLSTHFAQLLRCANSVWVCLIWMQADPSTLNAGYSSEKKGDKQKFPKNRCWDFFEGPWGIRGHLEGVFFPGQCTPIMYCPFQPLSRLHLLSPWEVLPRVQDFQNFQDWFEMVWMGQGSHKGSRPTICTAAPEVGLSFVKPVNCREPFFNCSTRSSRPPRREAAVVWSIQKVWQSWQSDSRSIYSKMYRSEFWMWPQSPAGAPQSPSGILAVVWS